MDYNSINYGGYPVGYEYERNSNSNNSNNNSYSAYSNSNSRQMNSYSSSSSSTLSQSIGVGFMDVIKKVKQNLPKAVDFHVPPEWIHEDMTPEDKALYLRVVNLYEELLETFSKNDAYFMAICDQLNSQTINNNVNVLLGVFKYIRIVLLCDNMRRLRFTVELIDFLIKNCNYRVHLCIGQQRFMKTVGLIGRRQQEMVGLDHLELADFIFDCIQAWGEAFMDRRQIYPHIWDVYYKLRSKYNIVFSRPDFDPSRVPIFLGQVSQKEQELSSRLKDISESDKFNNNSSLSFNNRQGDLEAQSNSAMSVKVAHNVDLLDMTMYDNDKETTEQRNYFGFRNANGGSFSSMDSKVGYGATTIKRQDEWGNEWSFNQPLSDRSSSYSSEFGLPQQQKMRYDAFGGYFIDESNCSNMFGNKISSSNRHINAAFNDNTITNNINTNADINLANPYLTISPLPSPSPVTSLYSMPLAAPPPVPLPRSRSGSSGQINQESLDMFSPSIPQWNSRQEYAEISAVLDGNSLQSFGNKTDNINSYPNSSFFPVNEWSPSHAPPLVPKPLSPRTPNHSMNSSHQDDPLTLSLEEDLRRLSISRKQRDDNNDGMDQTIAAFFDVKSSPQSNAFFQASRAGASTSPSIRDTGTINRFESDEHRLSMNDMQESSLPDNVNVQYHPQPSFEFSTVSPEANTSELPLSLPSLDQPLRDPRLQTFSNQSSDTTSSSDDNPDYLNFEQSSQSAIESSPSSNSNSSSNRSSNKSARAPSRWAQPSADPNVTVRFIGHQRVCSRVFSDPKLG